MKGQSRSDLVLAGNISVVEDTASKSSLMLVQSLSHGFFNVLCISLFRL